MKYVEQAEHLAQDKTDHSNRRNNYMHGFLAWMLVRLMPKVVRKYQIPNHNFMLCYVRMYIMYICTYLQFLQLSSCQPSSDGSLSDHNMADAPSVLSSCQPTPGVPLDHYCLVLIQ